MTVHRLLALLLWPLCASAQPALFPFTIDQDRLSGAPDFSFLNHPLNAADRLFVRDGHFYRCGADLTPNTADDERVKLFGINLAFDANFPQPDDAPRVARRLRKLGINIVRLHHMDTQPDSNPASARSLLTTGPYPTLNPNSGALLRGFLDALRAEGIYADLNLHVGYTFRPEIDGVPAAPAGQQIPDQSKPLHIFEPRMVELQARFASRAIEALKLRDDPVLALVEINNESSLLRDWQVGNLDQRLFPNYRAELGRQWNAWLRAKYSSTEQLSQSWRSGETDGPELLVNGDFSQGATPWRLEIHTPSQASFSVVNDGGSPAAMIEVTRTGDWVFFKQVNFSLARGAPYEAVFEARADLPDGQSRTITFDVKEDVSPWRQVTNRTVALTNRWQRFTAGFQPNLAMDGIGRFALAVESATGRVLVRGCSLRQAARRGLDPAESLSASDGAGNVSLVGVGDIATEARADDFLRFLAETDKAYLAAIRKAVRAAIPWPVAIAGTQMGYGGALNLDSHEDLDSQDNHFYVDHYNFPNVQWDGGDWRIRNASAVASGLDNLRSMAIAREAGRPYTVSEFNQPWPNTQAAEILPVTAAFAAFQDWDGIFYFAYEHSRTWNINVGHGFNLNGEPHKLASAGQSAWLFRTGAVNAGRAPVAVPLSEAARLQAGREKRNGAIGAFLQALYGYDPNTAFVHPVGIYRSEKDAPPAGAQTRPPAPLLADSGELSYDPAARIFKIHSERAAGLFGYLGAPRQAAGPLAVELTSAGRGFAAVLLTPLDGLPLSESRRLLLTLPGYTLRSLSTASPEPQALVNYPNTTDWITLRPEPVSSRPSGNLNAGASPNWMEAVEAQITLGLPLSGILVYPLDSAGARLEPLASSEIERIAEGFRFRVNGGKRPPAPWFEVVAVPPRVSRGRP